MITSIQAFLNRRLRPAEACQSSSDEALRSATAVLLMEVARADTEIGDEERQAIQRLIETHYKIPPVEAQELAASAEQLADDATSLYPFTRLIISECSLGDRINIVKMLWDVSYADGRVDAHEEHLVRKVADLLYVPHREFIRTRLQRGEV